MPYTLGPTYALTGEGTRGIASPVGLRFTLSGNTPAAHVQFGSPTRWYGMGRVAIGNVDGWVQHVRLQFLEQLVYPLPDSMTSLAYTLPSGITLTVRELVGNSYLNRMADPWDRNPAALTWRNAPSVVGGTGDTINWTYTVPAGRKLWVSKLAVYCIRQIVCQTVAYSVSYITLNGVQCVSAVLVGNTYGDQTRDEVPGGALVLKAGDALVARYVNYDTGGYVWCEAGLTGTLFDA